MDEQLLKKKLEGDENEVEEKETEVDAEEKVEEMPSEPVVTGGEETDTTPEEPNQLNPEDVAGEPTNPTEPTVTSTEENSGDVQETFEHIPEAEGPAPIVEENGAMETSIKTFTQDDVNKIVGDTRMKTREKTLKAVYGEYGLSSKEELDELVTNGQRYETQKELYESDKNAWETERQETQNRLNEMSEEIALMKSGVRPEKYEDAKLILKGKGLEVNAENIAAELEKRPEWNKEQPKSEHKAEEEEPAKEMTRIKVLGNEPKPVPQMSEEEQAQKVFKMKW